MAENDDEFELLFEENGADEANVVDQLREFSADDAARVKELAADAIPGEDPDTTNETDQVAPVPDHGSSGRDSITTASSSSSPSPQGTKYFIIRSNCQENIDISCREGAWSTTRFNEQKLNAAFHNSPEVRLMFSVNNSSAFQGYAVMRSAIGNLGRPVLWSGGVTFGSPFAVEWKCLHSLPSHELRNLTNPLNGNSPILKAKDCQELPRAIGDQIVALMEGRARVSGSKVPVPVPSSVQTHHHMRSSQPQQQQQQQQQQGGMGGAAGGRGNMLGGRFGGRGGGMRPAGMMQGGGMMPMHGMGMMPGGGMMQGMIPMMVSVPQQMPSVMGGQQEQRQQIQNDTTVEEAAAVSGLGGIGGREGRGRGEDWGGRQRSRSRSQERGGKDKPNSLLDMTYEEYLECYHRVSIKVDEVLKEKALAEEKSTVASISSQKHSSQVRLPQTQQQPQQPRPQQVVQAAVPAGGLMGTAMIPMGPAAMMGGGSMMMMPTAMMVNPMAAMGGMGGMGGAMGGMGGGMGSMGGLGGMMAPMMVGNVGMMGMGGMGGVMPVNPMMMMGGGGAMRQPGGQPYSENQYVSLTINEFKSKGQQPPSEEFIRQYYKQMRMQHGI